MGQKNKTFVKVPRISRSFMFFLFQPDFGNVMFVYDMTISLYPNYPKLQIIYNFTIISITF